MLTGWSVDENRMLRKPLGETEREREREKAETSSEEEEKEKKRKAQVMRVSFNKNGKREVEFEVL